jgi:hypothetical protein
MRIEITFGRQYNPVKEAEHYLKSPQGRLAGTLEGFWIRAGKALIEEAEALLQ